MLANIMLSGFLKGTSHIYLTCGVTDFRKQAEGLTALVSAKFLLDPYDSKCVFLFCNKRRNGIKALRFDKDGFFLASKKLIGNQKFQWPKTPEEVKDITFQQARWLYEGLEVEPKRAHRPLPLQGRKSCY